MPRLILTEGAQRGLERCRRFLISRDAAAAGRAAKAISNQLSMLETAPGLGRPVSNHAELREFLIEFGDSGYVVLYRHEGADESIVILAFRHQKEAGY